MNLLALDLFCGIEDEKGRHGWSAAFKDSGHKVVSVDIERKFNPTIAADINTLAVETLLFYGRPDIVLASPPCESFSVAAIYRNWKQVGDHLEPISERAVKAVALVQKTLDLIAALQPKFWVMENPRAALRKMAIMRPFHRQTVTYCGYGDTAMKPTDLWGEFPPSLVLKPPCKNGDPCHVRAPRGSKTPGSTQGKEGAALRGVVPYLLSKAFCDSAERDLLVENPRGMLLAKPEPGTLEAYYAVINEAPDI